MFSAASTAQWVTAAAAAAVAVVTIVYSSSSLSSVVRSALSRWVYRLQQDEERRLFLLNAPKRIILVRHGQSEGNVSRGRYSEVPDNKIELTPKGHEQAEAAGLYVRSFSFRAFMVCVWQEAQGDPPGRGRRVLRVTVQAMHTDVRGAGQGV